MDVPIEFLVARLAAHCHADEPGAGEAGTLSDLFRIAGDISDALHTEERERQGERSLIAFEAFAQYYHTREVDQMTRDEAQGEWTDGAVVALICTAAALQLPSHTTLTDSEGVNTMTAKQQARVMRWQAAALRLLCAAHGGSDTHSGDSASNIVEAVCFSAAQLLMSCDAAPSPPLPSSLEEQQQRRLLPLLDTACAVLRGDEGRVPQETLSPVVACEVLAQCAATIALRQPVASDALVLPTQSTAAVTGKKTKGNKPRRERGRQDDATRSHTAPTRTSMTASSTAHLRAVTAQITSCTLHALLSSTDAPATRFDGGFCIALCRRILIPLLLRLNEAVVREEYYPAVHDLLRRLAAQGRREEVVLLVAALFDFLFPTSAATASSTMTLSDCDYRHEDFLWSVLRESLWDALTSDLDAGRRANVELRVAYLLKRIVDLTTREEQARNTESGSDGAAVHFADDFVWQPVQSAQAWDWFFLVLEALKEFGWHMVQPVMAKLDALVTQLNDGLRGGGAKVALSAAWIELLLVKMLLHPNTAVRKAGLHYVWQLPTPVLRVLAPALRFYHVFRVAADPRLCTELDRSVITTGFVQAVCEADEALPDSPAMEPIVHDMERFYVRLFVETLDSATEYTAAMQLLLRVVLDKAPSRFAITALARTLHAIAEALSAAVSCDARSDTRASVLAMLRDAEVLGSLETIVRDVVQDNMPFWLDVRITAVLFSALLHLAAIAPATLAQHERFWRLLCLCGPLGQSCGKSTGKLDECGRYGTAGAALDPRFLHARLVALSAARSPHIVTEDAALHSQPDLLHALLRTDTFVERTQALLHDVRHCSVLVDETLAQRHFFLFGALLVPGVASAAASTQMCAQRRLVQEVVDLVTGAVCGFRSRPYSDTAAFLTSCAALVELRHTLGARQAADFVTSALLQEMADVIRGYALRALERAWAELHVSQALLQTVLGQVCDEAMHTTQWDIVTAALMSVCEIAMQHDRHAAATALEAADTVRRLVDLVCRCGEVYMTVTEEKESGTQTGSTMTRQCALILLSRNASRLLQALLCGFVVVEGGDACESMAATLPQEQETMAMGCFCDFDAEEAGAWVMRLAASLTQRLTTDAAPTAASPHRWPVLLAQHYRGVYSAMYVLCQRVNNTTSTPRIAAGVADFALRQVECCVSSNMACVYDLLCWVLAQPVAQASQQDEHQCRDETSIMATTAVHHAEWHVDHVAIVRAMLAHVNEVGAKQYTRLLFLAFAGLHYTLPHDPDFVLRTVHSLLDADAQQESDRLAFFVATIAALPVLRAPQTYWPILEPLLLRVVVFGNTGKDEEENESTMAATEPLLRRDWPAALRLVYPATVRLAVLGRALAIATVLWACARDAARALVVTHALLELGLHDAVLLHEPCMPNSRPHRARVRLWQLLCALLPLLPHDRECAQQLLHHVLHKCLTVINPTSVRHFMEIYAIRLLATHPSLYGELDTCLGDLTLRPQVCGSYVLVACHVLLQQQNDGTRTRKGISGVPGLEDALVSRLLQQSVSNQFLLRTISQIGLHKLHQAWRAKVSYDDAKLGATHGDALRAVLSYIDGAEEPRRMRVKHEAALFYDVAAAASPRGLFCTLRKEADNILSDSIPAAIFERIRFLETELACLTAARYPVERLRLRQLSAWLELPHHLADFADLAVIPHTPTRAESAVDYTAETVATLRRDTSLPAEAGAPTTEVTGDVQKKVTPWWAGEVYNELHPRVLRHRRQPVVVVASLLENPVNIAGLCRCGDIFAIGQIVIPERKVFEHPHFVAVARSAELWLPWREVAPRGLMAYLTEMQAEGYTLVGVEQTASSVSMVQYHFPRKSVIVLGAEGQGIPAPLIPLLDVCVEIPQYGLVRSLNVHVTGAIAMYEYTKQHLMTADAQT